MKKLNEVAAADWDDLLLRYDLAQNSYKFPQCHQTAAQRCVFTKSCAYVIFPEKKWTLKLKAYHGWIFWIYAQFENKSDMLW